MAYLALSPVSAAVYAKLNVAGMNALVGTRISDSPPRAATFPYLWFEVKEQNLHMMGQNSVPNVNIWIHAFSTYSGEKEAQEICDKARELLEYKTLTMTGFTQAGDLLCDDTLPLQDQAIEGVKVQELVMQCRVRVVRS